MDSSLVLRALLRRTRWLLSLAVVTFLVTATAMWMQPRYYVARAVIALNQNTSLDGTPASFGSTAAADRNVENVLLVARSDSVAIRAAQLLHISDVSALRHRARISQVSNTDAIQFTSRASSAARAQREANAWAEAAEVSRADATRNALTAAADALQRQLETVGGQLSQVKSQLARASSGSTTLRAQRDLLQKQSDAIATRQQQVLAEAAIPGNTSDVTLPADMPSAPSNPSAPLWGIAAAIAVVALAGAIGLGRDAARTTPEPGRQPVYASRGDTQMAPEEDDHVQTVMTADQPIFRRQRSATIVRPR